MGAGGEEGEGVGGGGEGKEIGWEIGDAPAASFGGDGGGIGGGWALCKRSKKYQTKIFQKILTLLASAWNWERKRNREKERERIK